MPEDLEIRLLRYFVAVAEELHFTRAAHRLYVSQQALSRDIRRLEDRLGVTLLDRTTRRVTLTPAGERFLARARQLVSLHDEAIVAVRAERRRVFVNVVAEGLTPAQVLAAARDRAPDGVGFYARFHPGIGEVLERLRSQRLDVAFGRPDAAQLAAAGMDSRLVRLEPLAVLLPDHHPLADQPAVPVDALRDTWVCRMIGNYASREWQEAGLQLLSRHQVRTCVDHPQVMGVDEMSRLLHLRDIGALTFTSQPPVPRAVLRPLVDPVPLYPWRMVWRADQDHAGLAALHEAVDALAAEHRWLDRPAGAWLPAPEASAAD